MSYSATSQAFNTLNLIQMLLNDFQPHRDGSNSFTNKDDKNCFWEIGRETRDGSITGTIFISIDDSNTVKNAGSFRIDSGGTIVRFPHLPRHIKQQLTTPEKRRGARFELLRSKTLFALGGTLDNSWNALQHFASEWQRMTGNLFVVLPRTHHNEMYQFVKNLSL